MAHFDGDFVADENVLLAGESDVLSRGVQLASWLGGQSGNKPIMTG